MKWPTHLPAKLIGWVERPFHRQAKGRPVAKPLSRAWQVSMVVSFFYGIDTLDKGSATSAIGGLSGKNG